jgi:hypothetical protein
MDMEQIESVLPASRLIGPEDIRPGQYVTVAEETHEIMPVGSDRECKIVIEPQLVTMRCHWSGIPFKVVSVALPYVLARDFERDPVMLDLRRFRLAVLPAEFAQSYFKAMTKMRKRQKD